jgi:hypothetical protein
MTKVTSGVSQVLTKRLRNALLRLAVRLITKSAAITVAMIIRKVRTANK